MCNNIFPSESIYIFVNSTRYRKEHASYSNAIKSSKYLILFKILLLSHIPT